MPPNNTNEVCLNAVMISGVPSVSCNEYPMCTFLNSPATHNGLLQPSVCKTVTTHEKVFSMTKTYPGHVGHQFHI